MEQERKEIIKKYKKNVKGIINRYKDIIDDEMDVIDIFNYEEKPTFCIESISFIKNGQGRTVKEGVEKVLSFGEVYRILCVPCDFEDICALIV